MLTAMFGARVQRLADARLVRGEGSFIDDIPLEGALHVAFVRSPFARARILSIDCQAAREMESVAAVYTCDDLGSLDILMPLLIPHPSLSAPRTQRPLARGDVFHVGQPVAMVVALDRYTAEDATRLIDVDYEPLEVELDLQAAVADGAPRVHEDVANNVAAHLVQVSGDPDGIFSLGTIGIFLNRKNIIVILMSIELMLLAVN
ncbi:MAG TPA: hypothetical protein QF630_09115, partial [Alphaproteobacteria bacterium]|nr:hypothetical protein [Alphaproteobacteria bacterium]